MEPTTLYNSMNFLKPVDNLLEKRCIYCNNSVCKFWHAIQQMDADQTISNIQPIHYMEGQVLYIHVEKQATVSMYAQFYINI